MAAPQWRRRANEPSKRAKTGMRPGVNQSGLIFCGDVFLGIFVDS